MLKRVAEPLILIDWSDLKADQSLHLLRASLPVGGRSLTLYEEVHPQQRLGNCGGQQNLAEKSKDDPDHAFKPDVVEQLKALKKAACSEYETFAYKELDGWKSLFLSTQDGWPNEVFADLAINGRRETWPVGGVYFKQWLAVQYFEETGDTPSLDALR